MKLPVCLLKSCDSSYVKLPVSSEVLRLQLHEIVTSKRRILVNSNCGPLIHYFKHYSDNTYDSSLSSPQCPALDLRSAYHCVGDFCRRDGEDLGQSFSDLVVFGDSLSDIGNVRVTTFGIAARAPYFNGRLTNGPNYVDYLAPLLGLGPPSHSLAGGLNYAYGGATVRGDSAFIDSLITQKNDYLTASSGFADPAALYIALGGGNDVRNPATNVLTAAADLVSIVSDLLSAGAQTIVVPNLPDLGLTPEVTEFGQGAGTASTARSVLFNAALAAGLNGLEADDRIIQFDLFGSLNEIVADAASGGTQFGITNVVDDCWEGGPSGFGLGDPLLGGSYPQCSNPDEYLFWDIVHPTSAAHEVLAEGLYQTLVQANVNGDFNDDGLYDCADIDSLVAAIATGGGALQFDLTGDGVVNLADQSAWLTEAGAANLGPGKSYLNGDANLNGVVDISDFNVWNQNKFQFTQAWCRGDFNADGVTDISDFNVWNLNKFSASDTSVVPEPQTLSTLVIWGTALLIGTPRRRSRRS